MRFCSSEHYASLVLPIPSPFRQYNVDYKLDTYLKIARLYLEDDDPVQAEAYINRASLLQNESSNEQLQIHYKVRNSFPSCCRRLCRPAAAPLSSVAGVLRQGSGFQEEVHRSSSAVQRVVLQVHRPRNRASGGSEARPELHHPGLRR